MDKQKNILLSVIYLLGKVWGRTYLQKFLYLLNREVFNDNLFDYKNYKYGPFCEDINDELTFLEVEGKVQEIPTITKGLNTSYTYELTESGKKIATEIFDKKVSVKIKHKLIEYTNKFRNYSPTDLLKYVYEKYPEVTENSVFERE